MKLYLIRHGETDANASGIIAGKRIDNPLNERGRRQILELALTLEKDFDALFSSTMIRAFQSADILSEHLGLRPIMMREEIVERDDGQLSGRDWQEFKKEHPEFAYKWEFEPEVDFTKFGGESIADVRSRLMNFINEVKKLEHKKVIAVCHGGLISVMYGLQAPHKFMWIPNASIHQFEI
jgi:broad specificity phosphatase PhoE